MGLALLELLVWDNERVSMEHQGISHLRQYERVHTLRLSGLVGNA
jgi:hypothetical protein